MTEFVIAKMTFREVEASKGSK